MATFVMGDIHGAHKAMVQCLDSVGFDEDEDTLVFLGDFCDGYSESYEVLRELSSIKKLVWIVGNHDHKFFRYVDNVIINDGVIEAADLAWEESRDGETTLNSFDDAGGWDWLKENLQFIKSRQAMFEIMYQAGHELPLCFVHGGIPYAKGMGESDLASDAGRSVMFDRSMYYEAYNRIDNNIHTPVNKRYRKVYLGHTPTRGGPGMDIDMSNCRVIDSCGVVMMDTGAGWGGPLAIRNVATEEVFYSQPTSELYPSEGGRGGFRWA